MISVGLVGFGLAGRVMHAPLIRAAGMQIAGVVSSQVATVSAQLPAAQVVADLEQLLALQPLDLVVVASPSEYHAEHATRALEAGKHVVIDKPFGLSLPQAAAVIATAEQAQRHLTVFHNRRWDSDFLTLRRLLHAQTLGEIASFTARWDRFRPEPQSRWRERAGPGSGLFLDLGPHLIDQALMLFGMPDWLQADIYTQRRGAGVDDAFELHMGKGRMRITLSASSLAADNALRYQVHGTGGSFTKSGLDVQEDQLRSGLSPDDSSFGVEPESQWGTLRSATGAAPVSVPAERGRWLDFYVGVRDCLASGAPIPVTTASALDVMKIVDAARRSSKAGVRVKL